jgi:hypothetical protein
MSQNNARKYSTKGIASKPKTFRQYKSAFNKIAWRKYHLTREDLGVSIDALKVAYAAETPVRTVLENARS